MAGSPTNGEKTPWEREKLLITSNFSISRCVFKRLVLQTSKNQGLFNPFPNKPLILCVCSKPFENTVRKGEIARNKQFLLFPPCFSTFYANFPPFSLNLKLSSASRQQSLLVWKSLKFVIWGRFKHHFIHINSSHHSCLGFHQYQVRPQKCLAH